MLYLLAVALCIGADQAVKYYVVSHLELYESAPLLPGVVELFHIQNTGGGFSILAGHTWVLTVLTAALMAGIAWMLVKKYFPHPLAMWTLTVILGGGLGTSSTGSAWDMWWICSTSSLSTTRCSMWRTSWWCAAPSALPPTTCCSTTS